MSTPTRQKVAAFDIDGTLYRDALYRDIVHHLAKQGLIEKLPTRVERAYRDWKNRQHSEAFNDYVDLYAEYFDSQIHNLTVQQFQAAVDELLHTKKDYVYRYTRTLVRKLKKKGYFLIAISGSQIELVEGFSRYHGFDDWIGQIHERKGNRFTGVTKKTYKNKEIFFRDMIKKHNLDMRQSIAIGDSITDVSLLETVEQPIAFNPERSLFEYASDKGWKIVIERKNISYILEKQHGQYILAETGK